MASSWSSRYAKNSCENSETLQPAERGLFFAPPVHLSELRPCIWILVRYSELTMQNQPGPILPPRATLPVPPMPRLVVPGRLDVAPHDDSCWFRWQPTCVPAVVEYHLGNTVPA